MVKNRTKKLVVIAFFIAVNIVVVRLLGIQTPFFRYDFGFLPISLIGAMMGPIWGGVAEGIADIIGAVIIPKGAYFPLFTVSAVLSGAIFGLFLYKRPKTWLNISLCVLTRFVVCTLFMTSIALYFYIGDKAFWAILLGRVIPGAVMLPIQVLLIKFVMNYFNDEWLS